MRRDRKVKKEFININEKRKMVERRGKNSSRRNESSMINLHPWTCFYCWERRVERVVPVVAAAVVVVPVVGSPLSLILPPGVDEPAPHYNTNK
ncbi:hypothetical protein AVEN_74865-1 [Araneus ventricosus]|uniref:Transmembrane protein n=1 Tax=Araneus ventricosus TaxID=182803 RepID=A0A4Y2U8P4_ARAVE|nr:hypothetical protein AVEN_74865-1 [Araneus ventricosus]